MKRILVSNHVSSVATAIICLFLTNGCSYLFKNPDNPTTPPISHIAPSTISPTPIPATPAPTTPTTPPTPTTSAAPGLAQANCIQPTNQDYIYGNYKVEWSLHGSVYKSVLQMRGASGIMLTEYFNPQLNATDFVVQSMATRVCSFGLVIAGSNPVNFKTRRPQAHYIADNLLISRQPNGKYVVFEFDVVKDLTPASITKIASKRS